MTASYPTATYPVLSDPTVPDPTVPDPTVPDPTVPDPTVSYPGGCACGQVRYRMQTDPMIVHCCHCKDCQRQTGTAFVLNALIETDRVSRDSGAIHMVAMPTDSGQPHHVARCAGCGTALWSHYGGREALSFVRVGTLDDPAALPPGVHIYTRSRLPWIALPPDVPAFEAYYQSRQVWSEASLARRKALFG